MKKKLLLFLLCACSCLVSHATAIYCTVDGINYSIEYGSATVKECYKNGDVVIPASITYRGEEYPVTVIGGCGNSRVTSVIIPSSVYYIEQGAFYGCTGLTSVAIPESVKTIERQTFYGCTNLVSITLPEGVTGIEHYAFQNCSSLASIIIPNSVTSIGWGVFESCVSLTSITIPNRVTSIGYYTFQDCSSLTSIILPDSLTSIGEKAFFGCSALTSVTISKGVTSIGEYAFSGCNSLESVTIPQSVSSIGNRAFADCTGTLYVNCPLSSGDGYTFRYTFNGCAFERIVVGDAVQSLPDEVFDGIEALKEVILPNTLTEIGRNAFESCTNLTSVTIPESVTSIGEYAFYGCRGLTSITIPESVTSIGKSAFYGCTGTLHINSNIASPLNGSFDQVILGPSVSAIGESVFRASLTTCFVVEAETPPALAANALPDATIFIYVPQGMTEIYQNAWGQPTSTNYTYIYVEQDPSGTCGEHLTWHFNPRSGHMTIEGYGEMTDVPWQSFRTNISSLSLPQGLTSICAGAFSGSKLTELHIPQGVSTIGNYAFSGCRLTELDIPEGVTTIGASAFRSNSLTKITLPSTLTRIDEYAYSSYTKLQEVHIAAATPPALGKNVFSFGDINFVYIPKNTTAAYQAAWGTDYHYIEPDGSADIAGMIGGQLSWAFNPQSGKLSIQGTGAIPNYGTGSNANQPWKVYRDYITSIELSEGITTIGNYAFCNLPNITELTIPASVTKIGYNILENSGATSLYYKAPSAVVGHYFNSGVINSSMGGWMIGTPSANAMFSGSQVESITFSDDVTEIPAFFFANNKKLRSITIPNTVTKIGGGAFFRCSNLRSVTLPEHLTIIDTCVFQESGIDTLIIPAGVTRICQNAFRNSKLHHIEIPESVTEIERGAFAGCNLGALRLPDALTALPDYLFTASDAYGWDNSSVRSLTIGKNIRELNTYMLENCTIDSLVYNARNAVSAEKEYSIDHILPSSVLFITFGDSVEVIPDYLCEGTKISKAILPNTVTKIGKYAFSECGCLTELVLSDSITSIGEYAFYVCYRLTSISLPEGIQTLSAYTFALCRSLQSVILPTQLTDIYKNAFSGCSDLQSIHLPEQVGYIGDYAFSECENLVNITLPKSVYHIGNSAFNACTSLQSLAYNGWYIGEDAFYKCVSLSDLSFTSDVDINAYAFSGCEALKTIHFAADTRAYIADYAFSNCYSLDTLVIPDYSYAAATIGAYAFKNCSGLRSVSLGTSVQSVGKQAFYGCYGLNELSIYSRCSLDDQAFAECPSLLHIYNYNAVPNTCNSSVFDGLDKFSCTLHVPQGTTDKYRIASVWRDFYYMEEMVPTYTVSVETASADWGSVTGGGEYLSGTEITLRAVPATGYRFVRWNDGNTDNPRTVTVTEDATYTAVFDVLQLLVTVLPSNDSHGVVTGGGWYNYGETTVLEATPATGYWFYCWQDGSKDNPRTVTVTEDITYTATFRPYTFTVSATADDASRGEVTGSGTYGYGDIATLDAIAYTGYLFTQWSDGNTDNPRTIVLTQDISLTAYFEEIPTYAVSLSCDAEQGTVSGSGTYREGEQVTVSAMPNEGYEFVQWSDGNTDNPRSWIVTEDVSLSAIFQPVTAMPQTTAASQETQKVVKDGQVLILRNGKAYDMLGQEVR